MMECETKGEQKMLGDVRELISHTLQKRGGCFDRCVCGQLSCYNLSWYSKDMWNIIGRAQRARNSELNGNFVCMYVCMYVCMFI